MHLILNTVDFKESNLMGNSFEECGVWDEVVVQAVMCLSKNLMVYPPGLQKQSVEVTPVTQHLGVQSNTHSSLE